MNAPRIYAYIDEKTRENLNAYAVSLGLKTNAPLLGLLIVRETHQRTLGPATTGRGEAQQGKKVVAELSRAHADQFIKITKSLGRSRTDCAAELLNRELKERWLERAVAAP